MIWIGLILFPILIYLVYRAYKNTYLPVIKNIDLELKNSMKIKPIKILHLSDFHMERISISSEQLIKEIDDKDIDLIALTGDYLEKTKNIDKFIEYIIKLKNLNPQYGIYVVFGNHDYLLKDDINIFQKAIENTGAIVLKNEHRSLIINNQRVNIIGIDDYKTKHSDLEKSYRNLNNGVNIVLTHDPNVVLKMKNYYFDYLLSGHFHGGQIYWPLPFHLLKLGKLPKKNIIKGLNFHQEKPYYINEGLGQTLLNLRLGSKPEITMHTIS